MTQVTSTFRWYRLMLVHSAVRSAPAPSAATILEHARVELADCGANVFSPITDNSFRFDRKLLSWPRTWIGLLSRGQVQATTSPEGIELVVQASIGRLLTGHLVFFSVCALMGLPLAFNLGLNLLVSLGNTAIAQWGLRRVARRAVSDVLVGRAA